MVTVGGDNGVCWVLLWVIFFFFVSIPPHVLVDFVVLPPGHGRSVTDFWGWDAHEAQLRCPNDVSGDIGVCSARRALKPKFYQPTQTMVTAGILPFRENSHGRASLIRLLFLLTASVHTLHEYWCSPVRGWIQNFLDWCCKNHKTHHKAYRPPSPSK